MTHKARKMIPIAEPCFEGNELKYLTDCINTGWISSVGSYVRRFEEGFSAFSGCKYGIAVHTGTAALHLALMALGIKSGDEVIIPTLTFASTANVVLYTGATPVLVDVEEETWNLDPDLVEKAITKRTKAIIPVHLYGHPCDMGRIMEIAAEYDLFIIEDAAEAHGAEYKGTKVGAIGTIGCFSFFGNKIITTGEGGMCLTNDPVIVDRIEKLRDHGMCKDKKYWHDEVGFNYRMTNLQAAVGVGQLERIGWFVSRKRINAELYREHLSDVDGLTLPIEKSWAKSVFWMYSILLKGKQNQKAMDELVNRLKNNGIDCRPIFYPLHKMPPYRHNGLFPNAEHISSAGLSLPSAVTLKEEQIKFICGIIRACLRR